MPKSRTLILALVASALVPALAPAQKVLAWGQNNSGQTTVPAGLVASQVAAGSIHSLALRPDGTVVAWGYNGSGQCNVPAGLIATQISGGLSHSAAILPNGTVTAWGSNAKGQCNVPSGLVATQISCGIYHTVALRDDNSVAAWGDNNSGQLNVPDGLYAYGVAAGGYHCLALGAFNYVQGWGYDAYGQADNPTGSLLANSLSANVSHSLAIQTDGSVYAWGDNSYGQCTVPAGIIATKVAAGDYHSLALLTDGTVRAWGDDQYGQCDVPAGLSGVLDIAAGFYHNLVLVAAAHCVLDQTQLTSGGSATGTVKLANPAPAGGTVVGLQASDTGVHVPSSVTVPQGATSATFPVFTDFTVGSDRTATIRTTYGATANEQRTVPASLKIFGDHATVAFSVPSIIGGSTTKPKFTVTLASNATSTVTLQTFADDGSQMTLPATLTIQAGSKTGTVTLLQSFPVNAATTAYAEVRNSLGSTVAITSLTLTPLKANLTFTMPTITGGQSDQGGVYLSAAVCNPTTVSLSSGDPSVTVPASVTVAAGARLASFPITTSATATNLTVPITATLAGNSFTANLRVTAISQVKSLTLPSSVSGNGKITGTVRLVSAAKAGGAVIQLSSSDASLSVPSSVTVPEGQYGTTFVATAADVASVANPTVTASNALGSATAGVTVNPLVLSALAVSPATLAGGSTITITVTLNTLVGVDTPVSLTSDNATLVPVPANIIVPAGSKTATLTVTAGTTATAKNVKITVAKNGASFYKTIKVTP